jgi:hypothetical protein
MLSCAAILDPSQCRKTRLNQSRPLPAEHMNLQLKLYRGADKSLDRPGRKQVTATEDLDVHISYLLP